MAFLHKISGYLVDVNEEYFEENIVTYIEQGLDLPSQHLHVETAQVEGWDDESYHRIKKDQIRRINRRDRSL